VDRSPELNASQPAAPIRAIRRAAIANLGCKVNQSEMDDVERLLRARGVELVAGDEPADVVVVNTCTVTSIADRKSRQAIRRARRASPGALLLVTGCTATVDPAAIAAIDPDALLFDNASKSKLAAELAHLIDLPEGRPLPTHSGVEPAFERAALEPEGARSPERGAVKPAFEPEGARAFELEVEDDDFAESIDRTRAFVKIQDGCSFHCTYCIIPRSRGPERSVPADAVLADVHRAIAAGHREIVLTGINAGTYADGATALSDLVRCILAETPIERIRLSSIEPQHVTDELLAVWTGSGGRCLPHFHIPLQSGDDTILRRMGRRYDAAFYGALLNRVRAAMPDVALHADLIAGFPGEDDAAWARTMAFLRGLDLAGVHVFRYSARPGTPAARMVGQVDGRTKKARAAQALELAAESRARFARRQLGRELSVLFERPLANGRWIGHAENHVLVEAASPDGRSLDNVVGLVRAEDVSTTAPGRVVGSLVSVSAPREPLAERAAK
jgi:threonylcarbamoyladenosine tRNA methylthiotransferase MtaB